MGSSSRGARRKREREGRNERGKKNVTPVKKTILIMIQGQVTENEYFSRLIHSRGWNEGVAITITVESEAPDIMVGKAEQLNTEYDYVYVVTDVDDYTNAQFSNAFGKTQRKSNRNSLRLVVSNPKFELWLCAHYTLMKQGCDASYVTRKEEELRILESSRNSKQNHRRKHLASDFPIDDVDVAISNTNAVAFGIWNFIGATSIPSMIEEIDKLNDS